MWDWLNCHVFGRHDFGIFAQEGIVRLRCLRCGWRSHGWDLGHRLHLHTR